MTVQRAWSSEAGDVLAYFESNKDGNFFIVNNRGEVYEQPIGTQEVEARVQEIGEELFEVQLFAVGSYQEFAFPTTGIRNIVKVIHAPVINRCSTPNGIEQLGLHVATCKPYLKIDDAETRDYPVPVQIRNSMYLAFLNQVSAPIVHYAGAIP